MLVNQVHNEYDGLRIMVQLENKPTEFLPLLSPEGLPDFEGSYYYNARWYDASTGRFISEDPARDGQNWYVYTTNNPIKYIDPTGLSRVDGDKPGDDPNDKDLEEDSEKPEEPKAGKNDHNDRDHDKNKDDKTSPDVPEDQVPEKVTPGQDSLPDSAEKILNDLGVGEDLAPNDGTMNDPTTEVIEPTLDEIPTEEDISGWNAYAGVEMIGIGVTVGGVGIATGNIPLAAAGVIAIAAGSELARNNNINNITEKVYKISKSFNELFKKEEENK